VPEAQVVGAVEVESRGLVASGEWMTLAAMRGGDTICDRIQHLKKR